MDDRGTLFWRIGSTENISHIECESPLQAASSQQKDASMENAICSRRKIEILVNGLRELFIATSSGLQLTDHCGHAVVALVGGILIRNWLFGAYFSSPL